MPVKGAKDG